ncbi:MAG: hypothetical protein H0U42_06335 [Thermoleophilaceae bacterium]|nr:hypothetical protein [Thermoleophilaceae bacterium]
MTSITRSSRTARAASGADSRFTRAPEKSSGSMLWVPTTRTSRNSSSYRKISARRTRVTSQTVVEGIGRGFVLGATERRGDQLERCEMRFGDRVRGVGAASVI